ncbi:MAG TPA: DUF1302 family protein [Methylomirabilota bacterium]|jgi:hypothetical protein|nr:DUF1302 family protein [Methylomirabilota bacterium]
MFTEATYTEKLVQFGRAVLLSIIILLTAGATAWTSTRLAGGDIEVQAWYRMRHTFQTDGTEHFDWVQWRNEAFVWLIHNNLITRGYFLETVPVPFIHHAAFSARYRARVDPVYYLREHYRNIYDAHKRSKFFNPEKEFRDLYVDLDFGDIWGGSLTSRIGYQQIVWGESDLFRSIDIINPLRIDQSFGAGEKFDEFRQPSLAIKAIYGIGDIGTWLSQVSVEPFYTPRFRNGTQFLLLENGWRIEFQEKNCLPPGETDPAKALDYSPENCGKPGTRFLPYRPHWIGNRRFQNPWSLSVTGNNGRIHSVDYACLTQACRPEAPGERITAIVNLPKGNFHHHTRGTDPSHGAGGFRIVGKTWFDLDFSLNYIFLPLIHADTNPSGHPADVYGDVPGAVGTLEEGLRRCLSPSGKQGVAANNRTNNKTLVQLVGVDLGGYNWPQRRLDAQGNPLPTAKQKHAARPPVTICTNGFNHRYSWTHVIGATGTYNDFEYTGAVFRFEESLSTAEKLNHHLAGYGRSFNPPPAMVAGYAARNGRMTVSTPVWRSMVGFDLLTAFQNIRGLGWTRSLPGQMGIQQSFISFQWLMQYYFEGLSNNVCNWNFAMGFGLPGRSGCRTNHFNHLLTLGVGGQGYFRSKLEQRLAVAFEPRGKQFLLFGQWWWREFMELPIDLSMGTAWYPNSRFNNSWTLLNYFTERNLLWIEATYYLL